MSTINFPYQIRISPRAKRISIRLTPNKGVELVVPKRYRQSDAEQFLLQHQQWIQERSNIWQSAYQPIELPTTIHLPTLGTWTINYHSEQIIGRPSIIEVEHNELHCISTTTPEANMKLLKKWLRCKAELYLHQRLNVLSEQTGLHYNRLSIRSQTTRWGSCSTKKNISLNAKLMFLDAELIDYVIIHELAHTIHFNHSKQFWDLVKNHCPHFRACIKTLKKKEQKMPQW